ncbi:MAG TPA: hypothetical protein VG122_19225, partial [Gemmata sp.]|nr:hypothetical protein [Gemmata sp.]
MWDNARQNLSSYDGLLDGEKIEATSVGLGWPKIKASKLHIPEGFQQKKRPYAEAHILINDGETDD